MLNKVIEKLLQLSRSPVPVNPKKFNDPIALQTAWTPLKRGGTNFRTHKLAEVNANRLEFRLAPQAIVFISVFLVIGSIASGIALYLYFMPEFEAEEIAIIIPGVFGLIFILISLIIFRVFLKPAVFDSMYGYFWKGRKQADFGIDTSQPEVFTALNQIHALQIISEFVRGNKSSYYSFELNLVLKDGSRKNVIDHGNIKRLREDALKLSQFLGKPVWDATINF